jgi:hypothetical protein
MRWSARSFVAALLAGAVAASSAHAGLDFADAAALAGTISADVVFNGAQLRAAAPVVLPCGFSTSELASVAGAVALDTPRFEFGAVTLASGSAAVAGSSGLPDLDAGSFVARLSAAAADAASSDGAQATALGADDASRGAAVASSADIDVGAVANPEPGTLALFALGLVAIAGVVRARRNAVAAAPRIA